MLAREFGQRAGVIEQAGAPVLGRVHQRDFLAVLASVARQRIADRLGVDAAHQLADQLDLAPAAFVGGDPLRHGDRLDQGVGQRQRAQLRRLQRDQRRAQRLQGVAVALALRFARTGEFRRRVAGVVEVDDRLARTFLAFHGGFGSVRWSGRDPAGSAGARGARRAGLEDERSVRRDRLV